MIVGGVCKKAGRCRLFLMLVKSEFYPEGM
jgi:hypothetical protein